jgi:hypothetical protein
MGSPLFFPRFLFSLKRKKEVLQLQLKTLLKEVKEHFQPGKPNENESVQRRNEIMNLNRRLEHFHIRFANLAARPPAEATPVLLEISRFIAQNEELLTKLNADRKLPVQQLLASHAGVSRKTLDDHHQYIITMALIFSGPYPYLRDYIRNAFS